MILEPTTLQKIIPLNIIKDENQINSIFRDYTIKIEPKLYNNSKVSADDVNNLVIFLNWCFIHRNNFFIEEFNKKSVFSICDLYNQLKTNILTVKKNIDNELSPGDLLYNISHEKLKTLKFILQNYINNHDSLILDSYHNRLCQKVTKDSVKNCLQYIAE